MPDDRPLCFVLLPCATGTNAPPHASIDFDRIFADAIEPAVRGAGLTPLRGDPPRSGRRAAFEQLLLCEYAIADLTTADADLVYELGVRDALRPRTTLALCARQQPIAFDVRFLRAVSYDLGPDNRFSETEAAALREHLAESLRALARQRAAVDRALFELLGTWHAPLLARQKTDVFRARVDIDRTARRRLAAARAMGGPAGIEALRAIERGLGAIDACEAGTVVDLFLSYRAVEGWSAMIELYDRMSEPLRRQMMVREQLGFALNRRAGLTHPSADRDRALAVLERVEAEQGPSAETCSLIGRVYKDLWHVHWDTDPAVARVHLRQAIAAYRRGFEADWRDAFPGVNLATLLDVEGSPPAREERDGIVPIVRYAVERRLQSPSADYWDRAAMLELAVLAGDAERALECLTQALAAVREAWEPKTTARDLELIAAARARRGEDAGWIRGIIAQLA